MKFKLLTKQFFIIDIVVSIIILVGLSVYDPLHVFHKSWITKSDRFHSDMRVQAAGIINNFDFDSIIIGSSMMRGTSAILASNKLGGKFVNISSNGASIFERNYITSYALKKKKIKKVITSFDTGMEQNLIKSNPKFPLSKFDFLYDDISYNDMNVYWNYKFLSCLITLSTSSYCLGYKRDIQRPIEWFEKFNKKNKRVSGIKNWVHNNKGRGKTIHARIYRHMKSPITSEKVYAQKMQLTLNIIEQSLFSLIKEHPSVEFHIIFPPYSRFLYALWQKKNPYKYLLYKETLRYLVVHGSKYRNLKVYSFDDMSYLNELNNYRDMRHYNTEMNNVILNAIRDKSNIIDAGSIDVFLGMIDKITSNYSLNNELNYILDSYKN